MFRLYVQDCLCINQLKANSKTSDILVCLVYKDKQEAERLKQQHFEEYELKHPTEYPSKVIYLCLNGYKTGDNYKSVHKWMEGKLDRGEIQPDDPGPYELNPMEL